MGFVTYVFAQEACCFFFLFLFTKKDLASNHPSGFLSAVSSEENKKKREKRKEKGYCAVRNRRRWIRDAGGSAHPPEVEPRRTQV